MTSLTDLQRVVLSSTLQRFPRDIQSALLNDPEFSERCGDITDGVIALGEAARFRRSILFATARAVFDASAEVAVLKALDGGEWRASRRGRAIVLSSGTNEIAASNLWCLAGDERVRIAGLDEVCTESALSEALHSRWRDLLSQRALEDHEVEALYRDLQSGPGHVRERVAAAVARERFRPSDIVPQSEAYFYQLVGAPHAEGGAARFVSLEGAWHLQQLLRTGGQASRLREVLGRVAHSSLVGGLSFDGFSVRDLRDAFEWVVEYGDPLSCVGAVECGLLQLRKYPELAPLLTRLVHQCTVAGDESDSGALKLYSALVVLVGGEMARTGVARARPPYWRRYGAMAHAAVVWQELRGISAELSGFIDWANHEGIENFYWQGMVDLREEPRWWPDLMSPEQLRAEFIGRIWARASACREDIGDEELRDALWGETGMQVALHAWPHSALPGPLEGGWDPVIDLPEELKALITGSLSAEVLAEDAFIPLVNASALYRIEPAFAQMATVALRRVRYQVQVGRDAASIGPLLLGLARVAAVTRNGSLAEDVRALYRSARDRRVIDIETATATCFVAAAARDDVEGWRAVVGDWLYELACGELPPDAASRLHRAIQTASQLEPRLLPACSRADAALSALLTVNRR